MLPEYKKKEVRRALKKYKDETTVAAITRVSLALVGNELAEMESSQSVSNYTALGKPLMSAAYAKAKGYRMVPVAA